MKNACPEKRDFNKSIYDEKQREEMSERKKKIFPTSIKLYVKTKR